MTSSYAPPPPPPPVPLDQPLYGATPGQAAQRFWRKFATFSGRASRSEYWWWTLVSIVVSIVLQVVGRLVLGGSLFLTPGAPLDLGAFVVPLIPSLVWSLLVLVPSVALVVRRLHDTNRRGWWYLMALPSIAGVPLQLIGTASLDPRRLAAGDLTGVAWPQLVAGGLLSLLGGIGGIVLLVFLIMGPDPRGRRFDRDAPVSGGSG